MINYVGITQTLNIILHFPPPFLGITQRKNPKKKLQPPSFKVKDEAWGFLFYKFDHNLQLETTI
jgi:hypothetical protein